MGEALIGGLIDAKWAAADEIVVAEILAARRKDLSASLGVQVVADAASAARRAATILLAVKPSDVGSVLEEIRPVIGPHHLVISIAAGITLAFIEKGLGKVPVVRVMPNTPAQIREGAAALAPGTYAAEEHMARAEEIISSTCRTVRLPERYLDAVTALSGSGPAYVFLLAEALIEAGVGVGLARDVATELTVQTILGSARMLRETGTQPAVLREMVTSPGGTTAAALRELERAGLRAAFLDAVRAATDRSREMASG